MPVLLGQGHSIVCSVRDKNRLPQNGIYNHPSISIFQADFLNKTDYTHVLDNLDAAYYLIHSMSSGITEFEKLEEISAYNFNSLMDKTSAKQVIYLSGIINQDKLSRHLASRKNVEEILKKGSVPLTTIRAGIIVGSGSASFEIMRDLVEKLPVMIAPKWLKTKNQPIAIRNVVECLTGVLLNKDTINKSFDIGGPDILTYKEMLLQFAKVRSLKRIIISVPVMTPRLSSYWLYFVTATSYKLAVNLVNSMKIEIICKNNELMQMLKISPISYREAVQLAFENVEHDMVISSWKDSLISSSSENTLHEHLTVPVNGCLIDKREIEIHGNADLVVENIWSIGGKTGWYYADWLWHVRGFIDKLFGGVGLRRGRTNQNSINAGDTLDFWRVIAADKSKKRLLLYAEMKMPGEAWLEFKVTERDSKHYLVQTATYRPRGLLGRMYWYSILPLHLLIFKGMAGNVAAYNPNKNSPANV